MEERLVARNSPLKLSLLLLVPLAFLALLLWGPQRFGLTPEPGWESLRWPLVILFSAVAVHLALGLFDRREQIVIGPRGIFMRQWAERTIPWTAIARCAIVRSAFSLKSYCCPP